MSDNLTIAGWASAARALGCSPSKLRRLVVAGPLDVPKDEGGVSQFSPAEIEALREALAHGWADPPVAQADVEEPIVADPETEPAAMAPASAPPAARPQPAPASPPAAPPAASGGALAARAFRLLDEGAGPSGLVMRLEIPPAEAMTLFEEWKGAKVADQEAADLSDALDLLRALKEWGWRFDDLVEAYRQVKDAEEQYENEGFTGDAALELLRAVHRRGMAFPEALAALRALPDLEERERRAGAAEAVAIGAQRRVQEAQRALAQVQGQLRVFAPAVGWLRLAQALAALVAGEGGAAVALRDALAALPAGAPPAGLLQSVDPAAEAEARRVLAAWAISVLHDLAVARAECDAAVQAARRSRSMGDVLTGALLARGGGNLAALGAR
jgi:hypothetical protein